MAIELEKLEEKFDKVIKSISTEELKSFLAHSRVKSTNDFIDWVEDMHPEDFTNKQCQRSFFREGIISAMEELKEMELFDWSVFNNTK